MENRREALIRASIDHWARLAENEPLDDEALGPVSCPLCQEYGDNYGGCGECPIQEATGKEACDATPYAAVIETWIRHTPNRDAYFEELEFLLSLLPEEHQ